MPRLTPGPINPAKPYSPVAHSPSGQIWTSGQVGYYDDGTLPATLEEQVERAMANLLAALSAAGATERDIVTVNVFLGRSEDFDRMNELYRQHFTAPYPSRTTITTGLRPGVLFEINAYAAL